jgi:hypothetical protein
MTRLCQFLVAACQASGLEIEPSYRIDGFGSSPITATALIRGLGGKKGMLIFRDVSELGGSQVDLVNAGYGYSVLSDPCPSEAFVLADYQDMFVDWGWSGKPNLKP